MCIAQYESIFCLVMFQLCPRMSDSSAGKTDKNGHKATGGGMAKR